MNCCGHKVLEGTVGQYCSSCGAQYFNWVRSAAIAILVITGTACRAEMIPTDSYPAHSAKSIVSLCADRLIGLADSKIKLPHFETDDVEFATYMLAVMYVESRFNTRAHSPANARGLMQVTPIAAEAAGNFCKIKAGGDLFNSAVNMQIGSCYLSKMREISGDWTSTLILYNGGFRQLKAYDEGRSIASETSNYVLKVMKARSYCLQGGI